MKYKTLIWSGCSHSFGSGMFDENNYNHNEIETSPVKWCSPKCYTDFPNVVSVADAMREVAKRAYPNQIGQKMGFENTYNLSVPGKGIETQLRKVTSFIIENEDIIDFSKAVFCYQIPDFTRFELLDTTNGVIDFANYNFNLQSNDVSTEYLNYFANHFDFDYYVAKFLMYLYEYKGFIESKGIVFLPFHFLDANVEDNYKEVYKYIKSEEYMTGKNGMLQGRLWEQVDVRFPQRKKLIEKIQHWNVLNWQTPNEVETLSSGGYCSDNHWSPKGHDAISDNLIPMLKEKLGI
jgi:hypothetical protein